MVETANRLDASSIYYWGEGGQYGPFEVQQCGEWAGWPDFGQVMRYFRKKAGLSSREFGELYGKEVNNDGSAIVERWIRSMELENKVPVDINKRKTIARLLKIPPALFGLAVLEDIILEPQSQVAQIAGYSKLQKVAVDTTKYINNNRTIWQLHETSSTLGAVEQVYTDLQDLTSFEQQTKGDLHYHVQEILLSDQILATHITRDQRRFTVSYAHANEAVRIARGMNDADLLAVALYTRGCTCLEWGLFGMIQQSVYQIQRDKISAAVRNFEAAKKVFPTEDGQEMHPQLFGVLSVHLSRALAILSADKGEKAIAPALIMMDSAADFAGKQPVDDSYTRVLIVGSRTGFVYGGYLDNKAATLNAAGLHGKAWKALNELETLTEQLIPNDSTRNQVWIDVVRANTLMGMKEYAEATKKARKVLRSSYDINSSNNVANIVDIYGRLMGTSHKASSDVKELGDMLREIPFHLNEK